MYISRLPSHSTELPKQLLSELFGRLCPICLLLVVPYLLAEVVPYLLALNIWCPISLLNETKFSGWQGFGLALGCLGLSDLGGQ